MKKRLVDNKYIMLSVILLFIVFLIISVYFRNVNAQSNNDFEKIYVSIEINEGDTLYSLANNYAINKGEYQDYINEVRYINNLKNDTLYSGCYLLIPVYVNR